MVKANMLPEMTKVHPFLLFKNLLYFSVCSNVQVRKPSVMSQRNMICLWSQATTHSAKPPCLDATLGCFVFALFQTCGGRWLWAFFQETTYGGQVSFVLNNSFCKAALQVYRVCVRMRQLLPTDKDLHVRRTGNSELSLVWAPVQTDACLSTWPWNKLETCAGNPCNHVSAGEEGVEDGWFVWYGLIKEVWLNVRKGKPIYDHTKTYH